jgi:hypothetical protein
MPSTSMLWTCRSARIGIGDGIYQRIVVSVGYADAALWDAMKKWVRRERDG